MSYLAQNPRRTLAALGTALLAVAVAVGSGATFSTHKPSAANVVASGSLIQTNDKDGLVIFTRSNMKPGDTATGTVSVTNSGTLAGDFTLKQVNASSTFSDGMMTLRIVEQRGTTSRVVHNGDIDTVGESVSLGRFAAGESRAYAYTATFNSSATVAEALKSATAEFHYDSVQSTDQSADQSALLAGV